MSTLIDRFDVTKNYVIEASAGTGKTFNIVEIVKKLLDHGVDLQKMLIVTYTDKAAGELKDRIRKAVGNRNVNVDEASIGTIHSFCQKAIEEFCISSGKSSSLEIIDEDESDDFIRRFLRRKDIYPQVCRMKVLSIKKNVSFSEDSLTKKIREALKIYYLDASFCEDSDIVVFDRPPLPDAGWRYYEGMIKKGLNLSETYPEVKLGIERLKQSSNPRVVNMAETVERSMVTSQDFNFNAGQCSDRTVTDPEEREVYWEIRNLRDNLASYQKKAHMFFIIDHIEDIYQGWQEEKAQNGKQTFNDMLRDVREEVMKGGEFLENLRNKYQYAVIDEFQDTNQKQWDIFKSVFLTDNHNITVVGDPKQSIYSFQGADLNVYYKAVQDILNNGGNREVLTKNFRATGDMIKSTGEFFQAFKPAGSAEPDAFSGFEASTQGNPKFGVSYEGNQVPAYWVYHSDADIPDYSPETYAKVVCQTIADCCGFDPSGKTRLRICDADGNWRNVRLSDFAILSRSASEKQYFMQELTRSGIPFQNYKDSSLFRKKECADWCALLSAIGTPDFTGKNRSVFRKALFTRFFGYSLQKIDSVDFDRDDIPEVLLFQGWRKLAADQKWDRLIDDIIVRTGLEEKMKSLKDLRSLSAMRQIGDYCADYLMNGHSLGSLIRNLKARLNSEKTEEESENEGIVAKGTDFDSVKVMTIHASKGLEFPVVFFASGIKGLSPNNPIYYYHNNGQFMVSFSSGSSRQETLDEWKRLFYVAFTRAKYVLMFPEGGFSRDVSFLSEAVENYIQQGKPYREITESGVSADELKTRVKEILDAGKIQPEGIAEENDQLQKLKDMVDNRFSHHTSKKSYSQLSHQGGKKKKASPYEEEENHNSEETEDSGLSGYDRSAVPIDCSYDESLPDPEKYIIGYPAGKGPGIALHEVFEKINYQDTGAVQDEFLTECFRKQGIRHAEKWVGQTRGIIDDVLGAELPEIQGASGTGNSFKLSDIPLTSRRNEVEFNYNKAGEYLRHYFNGFIDLIIKRGEYYSILDWKSDKLREDFNSYRNKDVLKKHVDSMYSIQRVLYSYTLIEWLHGFYPEKEREEIFREHFGGVYYVFFRGCNKDTGNGIYAQTWKSYKDLKAAYDKILSDKVKGHDDDVQ